MYLYVLTFLDKLYYIKFNCIPLLMYMYFFPFKPYTVINYFKYRAS